MDLKTELMNFKPINLEEIDQGDVKVPDKIRNSIFLYNKAIESLKSGSEDIAIIELKKATAMNPEFNEALNLLGICYSYIGDKEKAAEAFGRVMKAESNSILAMDYMQRLDLTEAVAAQKNKPVKQPPEQSEGTLKRVRSAKTKPSPGIQVKKQTALNGIRIAAGFIVGFALSAVVFLSLPQKEAEPDVAPQDSQDAAIEGLKAGYEAEYADLKSKYDLLQKDKNTAVQMADYYKAALKLYEIENLYEDRKYEDAADMILLMKTVEFRDEEKARFKMLSEKILPLAAKSAYDQGYKLYNSRKYQDSLNKFEKVQVYEPEYKRMDAVLYYMGRCCQALQDSRSAMAFYQKLLNNYPKSTYAKSANVKLKELTQLP